MRGTTCAALLIGGRSGVGKSSVGWEVAARLRASDVAHCFVEGDTLDQIHPPPPGDPSCTRLTEENLAALWRNFAARGQRRLIYTNTVSVVEAELVARAMGGSPRITAVLLTASDATAHERLAKREIGGELESHARRSAAMARRLEREAPPGVVRVDTDGRTVVDIARQVAEIAGWAREST